MKVCESCVFNPGPKSPIFNRRVLIFAANPIKNFVFFMTSFNASLCCSVNNQGRALVFMQSPLLFDSIKKFSA